MILQDFFTEEAIDEYLYNYYMSLYRNSYAAKQAALAMKNKWKNDKDWWKMITTAKADQVLFGEQEAHGANIPVGFYFYGEGDTVLIGGVFIKDVTGGAIFGFKQPFMPPFVSGPSLVDIFNGQSDPMLQYNWITLWDPSAAAQSDEAFPYVKSGYSLSRHTPGVESVLVTMSNAAAGGAACFYAGGGVGGAAACAVLTLPLTSITLDYLNLEPGDYQINIGPLRFNFQGWGLESPSWK